jgi:formate dehydrogenase alpha subunit
MRINTTATICPFCGVGCGLGLRVHGGHATGVEALPLHPVSAGRLCAKGWNAAFGIEPGARVTTPLIREHGRLRPASWNEALDLVAGELKSFLSIDGPDALGVISSARATNEDNYAAQKFARVALGSPNIDHCARICHSPSVAGLKQTLGSGAMTNSMADAELADCILVWGADPTENHAVFGARILRAKTQRNVTLIVVDPRETRLAQIADMHLQLKPGSNIALANAMLHVIFAAGLEAGAFLAARVDGVDALKAQVAPWTPARAAVITGVPAEQIVAAAQAYATSAQAFLCYGMGITQFATGTHNVIALSNLVLATGHVGRPGTGINPLRGQNNVQGACDMGCLPNVFPGYQNVEDEQARQKFSRAWGRPMPAHNGLTSLGMQHAARGGKFRAMVLAGEDPVVTDPDQHDVARALKALDLFVVIELSLTETALLADVVLPAASFAEKDGTFTNCERRVQRVNKALDAPGMAMPDWWIFAQLAQRLGAPGFDWAGPADIFNEMAALSPILEGCNWESIAQNGGVQWPCNAAHPQGSPVLHTESFPTANGRARLIPVEHVSPAEMPDAEFPLCFTTNRLHFHYGCGSMTRLSPLLERENPAGLLFMNPHDARDLHLHELDGVGVRSRRGYVETRLMLSEHLPPGLAAMPYHFRETPSNLLTNNAQDPYTHMPELKACAVRVEKLPDGQRPRTAQQLALADALRMHPAEPAP